MDSKNIARVFSSLLYLGLLFGGGGWAYYRIQHFEGIFVVAENKAENIVLRPGGEGNPFGASYRNLPFDVIPILQPSVVRKVLDPLTHYDAAELPAALQLAKIEVKENGPREEWIELDNGAEKKRIPAVSGETFTLGKSQGEVIGVKPWIGLVAHAQGSPLAVIRLNDTDAESPRSEKFILSPKSWLYHENYAVYFDFYPDETQAIAALPDIRPGIESARWGIQDNKRTHWLNSFSPGTGMGLDNGDEVTLLGEKMADAVPAILVQINRRDNTASRIRLVPGETQKGFTFEYPATKEHVVYVHSWRDDASVVRVLSQGFETPSDGGGFVEVLQSLERAVPVDGTGDPVFCAILRLDEKEHELREGLRVALDGGIGAMQYMRMPPPVEVRYHFNASSSVDARPEIFTLRDGENFTFNAWNFRLHPDIKPAPGTVVLLASRGLNGPAQYAGIALFIFGALGWVLVRLIKPVKEKFEKVISEKLDELADQSEAQEKMKD